MINSKQKNNNEKTEADKLTNQNWKIKWLTILSATLTALVIGTFIWLFVLNDKLNSTRKIISRLDQISLEINVKVAPNSAEDNDFIEDVKPALSYHYKDEKLKNFLGLTLGDWLQKQTNIFKLSPPSQYGIYVENILNAKIDKGWWSVSSSTDEECLKNAEQDQNGIKYSSPVGVSYLYLQPGYNEFTFWAVKL
ncbi:hypothetical protein ESOMN_v1c00820 [Williamsoniiplasma somnilux]|uniref:Uncharacterized protein n=1 Tax=Williamsoniiplasma somnilux TaxID=215578 RepID=A0A2K8NXF4_9MOLU|nr:hypothetical protein [Williamsoniiplasma somnilux]ATZ18467.1 hypothetical protein ESOMN_v1c00820 [Williamsoniiplasma somnilux]